MPIFVSQGCYSQGALKGMLANPEDRSEAAGKLIQAAGGKMLAYYVTFGEYDWLVVSEMPDEQHAAGGLDQLRGRLAAVLRLGQHALEGSLAVAALADEDRHRRSPRPRGAAGYPRRGGPPYHGAGAGVRPSA